MRVPTSLALLATQAVRLVSSARSRPFLFTPDAVKGANANLVVDDRILWEDLGIEPKHPTIHEGIPAVLDNCISFRWLNPLADPH